MTRTPLGAQLPDFPWDTIAEYKALANAHPDGIVDLSVGTPVDPVSPSIQLALANHAAEPGYPQTMGTPELRAEIVHSLERRYHAAGLSEKSVLPVIGTKEAIAWLPTMLGVRGSTVAIPEVAYPTYEVGALIAGCRVVRADAPADAEGAEIVFINSPSNPTGRVASVEELRAWAGFARETGAIIASDECYMGLPWSADPVSLLDPRVTGGDNTNLLAIHSLSKTSNMASYRAGMLAGDERLIQELLAVRKHAGLMVPGPIQHAMVASLADDDHEAAQRLIYAKRRALLIDALITAGFSIDYSEAGLYLWARRDGLDSRGSLDWLARRGILAAPGDFYGPSGSQHVRVGLTATDERIAAAAARLGGRGADFPVG
ncbi:succinyldiaminopimelate transaminase [Corynebacterium liangguodongii]|uniref:Succinyldiaminopimelate transaminase n=1 Tax=Corynebacterium liangguodongii TaxID=2079535 RepID=A0A2S0WDP4_9CORY|nr:succinyldiaminopimelate transaminase [Corynebacterium liangguodongii]AWB83782.1 succinyldiaminopimelate transaminase [Corynebacterium liangguodongii]PWB98641.1 succinyldiaminopimelate transaminase [Corynebacterium liangguodongii]